MIETIISVVPEYRSDSSGNPLRFRWDREHRRFNRDTLGHLIADRHGKPFRQWRPEIKTMDDIWQRITEAASLPGVTGAPKLQPIAARLIMLQSGMRAPIGIKIKGPDLATIESFGLQLEQLLKNIPSIDPKSVFAERSVGKPYFEIEIDRDAAARYGLSVEAIQNVITVAIGGQPITTTIEGRERYNISVRYPRELRSTPDAIGAIAVSVPSGAQIPLRQLSQIVYRRGPQMIRSEETFLTGYVLFDKMEGYAEVDVVSEAEAYITAQIKNSTLSVPAGVSYRFAGNYENQVRSEKRLALVLPTALALIFLILYAQFKRISTVSLVFSGIIIAWAGGFILLWLYGQPWFMQVPGGENAIRELLSIHKVNLSVAIWVGFLALFGIATDDGVVMCTYLEQQFSNAVPKTISEIQALTIQAASRRVRPALMTSATTILALLPVLTSTGRGADVMIPMAIPSFGGMCFALVTIFQAPVLYCLIKERQFKKEHSLK